MMRSNRKALLYREARPAPIYGRAGVCRNVYNDTLEKAVPGFVQTPTLTALIYGRLGRLVWRQLLPAGASRLRR